MLSAETSRSTHATHSTHSASCGCLIDAAPGLLRRRQFLTLAAGAGLAAALMPRELFAAEGDYEAMMLTCIDPRFTGHTNQYVASRNWQGKYSHFSIAGAALGAVAPAYATWHKTFWENLAASIELHRIKALVALNHRDCGAAKLAYGAEKIAVRETETALHRDACADFRKQTAERQPSLKVLTGLVALDGSIEWFA